MSKKGPDYHKSSDSFFGRVKKSLGLTAISESRRTRSGAPEPRAGLSRRTLFAGTAGAAIGWWVGRDFPMPDLSRLGESEAPDDPDGSSGQELGQLEKLNSFIDNYKHIALEVEQRYGVPHEVVLAMGIKESGYGSSDLATEANNFHGMKANNEWSGETYSKVTKEHVSEEDLKKYRLESKAKPLGGGMYEIEIRDTFKKFPSLEAGFLGFGEHLRTRFKGEAYKDAFEHKDPRAFARALFDTKGARWATDIEYVEGLMPLIDKILGEEDSERPMPSEHIQIRPWSKLSPTERSQFKTNGTGANMSAETNFRKSADQLMLVEPTPEAYKKFVGNIKDISDDVAAMDGFSEIFPSADKFKLTDKPRIVLHFTAWQKSAWRHNGIGLVRSLINTFRSSRKTASVNYYMGRDGKKLEVLTKPGQAAYHAGRRVNGRPHYSAEATGIEVPALIQSDVTPEMYEGLVYTVCWQYRRDNPGKKPTQKDMRRYVIGHGEIAEMTNGSVTNHGDFPRVIADAISDLSWRLLQKV